MRKWFRSPLAVTLYGALLLAGSVAGLSTHVRQAVAQGVAFWPNPVAPTVDAAYDIGLSTRRFRTLYLSGVAGTGGLRTVQTTPPTCTNNCGTDPSIVGSDYAMVITAGSGSPASPMTVTFNGTWGAPPACVAVRRTGTAANVVHVVETTTTTAVITVATAVGASTLFSMLCQPVS